MRGTTFAAVALLGMLAGCAGESPEADRSTPTPTPSPVEPQVSACTVTARMTEGVESRWSGAGTVEVRPLSTVYRAEHDQMTLEVYAGNDAGVAPSALLTVESLGFTYTTRADAPGLQVSRDGTGATLRTDLSGDAGSVHVVAEFRCG